MHHRQTYNDEAGLSITLHDDRKGNIVPSVRILEKQMSLLRKDTVAGGRIDDGECESQGRGVRKRDRFG